MNTDRKNEASQKETREINWRSRLYVHFVRSEQEADQVVEERKLRASSYQGREDRIFAVDLDETVRNDRVQLGNRVWGVLFTTPEADVANDFREEVYWFPHTKDDKGIYLPLEMVIKLDLHDVETARDLLGSISPEWGEPSEERYW